ncbi:hypothetical protein HHK36_030700 [Tetracentron sinense]|uniref:Uncharacterized protein n=1 Tax=Tetracentron sinense TaxID=13715 RepID=A0A834YD26_TETSI|nr:hypothetical protein HHK36_030700 [Tetracentron sinense]
MGVCRRLQHKLRRGIIPSSAVEQKDASWFLKTKHVSTIVDGNFGSVPSVYGVFTVIGEGEIFRTDFPQLLLKICCVYHSGRHYCDIFSEIEGGLPRFFCFSCFFAFQFDFVSGFEVYPLSEMAKFSCFSVLIGRKNKYKEEEKSSGLVHHNKGLGTLKVKLEADDLNCTSFNVSVPFDIQGNSTCKVKVVSDESPNGAEAAYEAEDEHDDCSSIKRDLSDSDLQSMKRNMNSSDSLVGMNAQLENKSERDAEVVVDLTQSGHVSDPGIGIVEFWASPKLKRSCSNLETRQVLKNIADQMPPSKSQSFEDLQVFSERMREEVFPGIQGSPGSVMTPCSADRVMLKKHSSSQVLPSRSRRLWWKLFLWSHRNLHKPWTSKSKPLSINHTLNQQGGYSSDTLEPNRSSELGKLRESRNNDPIIKNNQNWDNFHGGVSGLWPPNQWVAFSAESSSLTRVDEWVNSLETEPPLPINDEETGYKSIVFPPSPETGGSPARSTSHMSRHPSINVSAEVLHANSVIQSLNSSSTVAHIMGMGLKVIPTISRFSSLRSVDLSGNFIVHINPGSLPKGLHTLNLSRNKIATIEGLRELTRLRVLNLSYNRISRIGHGISNCTLIKELYLAGNKISDVEGLHRLLKLTVLDLSFNKLTTVKALSQLAANYNSLLALNLLGNPIQSNIGDDQLRKVVSGILPQLAYLNKQSIKPHRVREVVMDSVAKAALGNNGWTSHRKSLKRVGQGGLSSSGGHRSSPSAGHKSRHRLKSRSQHQSPMKRMS